MSDTPKVIAKVTFFLAVEDGERCVRAGDELDVTDPIVQAAKSYFRYKPGHEPKPKATKG